MRPAIPLINRLRPRRSPELLRARAGVYLVFLANGLGFANLVPRFPEIVAHLGLSKAAFGQAVAAASVGALVAGLAASWLIARLTSAKVASLGMLVVALALLGAGLARSWIALAACLLVVGGTDAIVDVVETGATMKQNGLQPAETIMQSSAHLIANKNSFVLKRDEILNLRDKLARAIA